MRFIIFVCLLLIVKVFEFIRIVPSWIIPAREKPINVATESSQTAWDWTMYGTAQ